MKLLNKLMNLDLRRYWRGPRYKEIVPSDSGGGSDIPEDSIVISKEDLDNDFIYTNQIRNFGLSQEEVNVLPRVELSLSDVNIDESLGVFADIDEGNIYVDGLQLHDGLEELESFLDNSPEIVLTGNSLSLEGSYLVAKYDSTTRTLTTPFHIFILRFADKDGYINLDLF